MDDGYSISLRPVKDIESNVNKALLNDCSFYWLSATLIWKIIIQVLEGTVVTLFLKDIEDQKSFSLFYE